MPFTVPVASLNAQSTQTVGLDGIVYQFTFTWNTRCLDWGMSIALQDGTPLVQGIKLLPQKDLLNRHKDVRLPKGTLLAVDVVDGNNGLRPAKSELGTQLILLYYTEAEVNALISA